MTCRRGIVGAVLVASLVGSHAGAQTCDPAPLMIRNTSVWTRHGLVASRDVVFRAGRVAAIEPTGARRDARIRTIDGTGHTLVPGLIDAHLHFSIPGGLPASGTPRADAEDIAGRQLVRSGVTSGRLHLATLDEAARLKARSANDCAPLPRLQVGGPGLSGAAERDFGNFQGARTSADALEKVARARDAGLDWVAIHDAERFPPGVLETVAGAARKAGLRLMAAGGTPQEITAALTVTPDTLDYIDGTAEPLYAPSILDAIRSHRDLVLVPTPGVPYRTGAYLRDPALLAHADNFVFLAAPDRAFVLANATRALSGADAARAERLLPHLRGKLQQLRQLGLPMAIGTDAGSPLHFQAGGIWWELEAWRRLGVPHREALLAATEHGARVLRADDIGRLAVGRRADFVLYRGNVEHGPFDMARVLAVGKGGVVFVDDGTWVEPRVERGK